MKIVHILTEYYDSILNQLHIKTEFHKNEKKFSHNNDILSWLYHISG